MGRCYGRTAIPGAELSSASRRTENTPYRLFHHGRSENSRNRVFDDFGDYVTIFPYEAAKLSDPSLVIYTPVRKLGRRLIVTNGDQTDTIYEYLKDGKSFEEALETREFEPDKPNYTPRISALLDFEGGFCYNLSILKSADEGGSAATALPSPMLRKTGSATYTHPTNPTGTRCPRLSGNPVHHHLKQYRRLLQEKSGTTEP